MAQPQRFFDQSQPQTLQIATFLLYARAVILVITGAAFFLPFFLLVAVGAGAGGYGIANGKKWGYGLAVGTAILELAAPLLFGFSRGLIGLMIDIALVALLVHPQSRDYQRIWFS